MKNPRTAVTRMIAMCLVLLITAAIAALAQKSLVLRINGRTARHSPIVVKGKTYVPVDALRESGVTVKLSAGTVAITLPKLPTGGAPEQAAVAGSGGEWLQNGIWRFRVHSLERADPARDGNGWLAKVEIRNSTKQGGYAPSGTGWQGITIVLEDGNSVPARSDAVELRDMPLAPGAANTQTLYFETESKNLPVKLILRFDPNGLEGTPSTFRFTVPDPSFRVNIRNIVRPNC